MTFNVEIHMVMEVLKAIEDKYVKHVFTKNIHQLIYDELLLLAKLHSTY